MQHSERLSPSCVAGLGLATPQAQVQHVSGGHWDPTGTSVEMVGQAGYIQQGAPCFPRGETPRGGDCSMFCSRRVRERLRVGKPPLHVTFPSRAPGQDPNPVSEQGLKPVSSTRQQHPVGWDLVSAMGPSSGPFSTTATSTSIVSCCPPHSDHL